MASKAGKFTLRPGDITVPGGNSGFHVEVGFEPDIVIVMTTGQPSENTWKTASDIWGGMMIMNNMPGYPRTGVSEWWTTQPAAISFFSDTGVVWFRGPSSGAAMYLSNTYADGFDIGYPGGGYEGNYGAVCYYLAIQTDDNVGVAYGYQGSSPVTLGWEPNVFFTLASGGLGPGPGDIAFADFSVPSFAFGGIENSANPDQPGPQWLSNGLTVHTTVEQVRFFEDGWGTQVVFDGYTASQIIASGYFDYGRTATTFNMHYAGGGFPEGTGIRGRSHIMEGGLFSGGAVTPNPVGTPLEIDTQFDPEAVIFLGPQPNYGNLFGNPWGGRCIGFLTEDFECCIAWGAYSHVGSAWSFCTSDYSWISNFTENALSAPTTPNYGSAELDGAGIILHSLAMPKPNHYIRYMAFGLDESSPGFFRRYGG